MFSNSSRYAKQTTYTVTLPHGRVVVAVRLPLPPAALSLAGYHTVRQDERLDLIAARYLQAPTMFWKLCDANGTPSAPTLAARALVGIPAAE